jgi:hypothetical protein
LCVLLTAGLVFSLWSMRTRSAAMLLPDSDSLDGVSLIYSTIVGGTPSGPVPQLECGQPAMKDMFRLLNTLQIRPCGGDPYSMELPSYDLYFCEANGAVQATLYLTSKGHLYCNNRIYRILSPTARDVWTQLGDIYKIAAAS